MWTRSYSPPQGTGQVREIISEVGGELGLEKGWLNDGMKGFLHGVALGEIVLDEPGITVRALAPEQLLAMKLTAWRDDVDIEDARALLGLLEGEKDAVWTRVQPFLVPGRELKAQYAFEDLWETRP